MKVKITVTAVTGRTDGYAELMLGTMMMAGLLRERPKLTKRVEGNETTIFIRGDMNIPPLGHLGELDIEDES
jgi:hypothetical protein